MTANFSQYFSILRESMNETRKIEKAQQINLIQKNKSLINPMSMSLVKYPLQLPLTLHFTYFILAIIGCLPWKYESKYIEPKEAMITILVLGVIQIALTILLLSLMPKSNMVLKERWEMTFISFM